MVSSVRYSLIEINPQRNIERVQQRFSKTKNVSIVIFQKDQDPRFYLLRLKGYFELVFFFEMLEKTSTENVTSRKVFFAYTLQDG